MEANERDKICENVILLLSSGNYSSLSSRTQQFYIAWSKLTKEQQGLFDSSVTTYMPSGLQPLYQALMDAFGMWDKTQNLHGAPGWSSADITSFEETELAMRLSSLIHNCEAIWRRFRREILASKQSKNPNVATEKEIPTTPS